MTTIANSVITIKVPFCNAFKHCSANIKNCFLITKHSVIFFQKKMAPYSCGAKIGTFYRSVGYANVNRISE